jgi:hypothetical protein
VATIKNEPVCGRALLVGGEPKERWLPPSNATKRNVTMRLTLRTLLAYLDDILEPADARDLGQKIEESEFASGLVHRIRSVTRKLRLGAPKLSGKGMGLDANTVAEYLDNTLPQDRVPDFEKVCLESDVHLAEVASCHQILTLVLGEPADVDPGLRQRIRTLIAPADDAHPEAAAYPTAPATPSEPTSPPVDRRREDPDWDEPAPPAIAALPDASPAPIRVLPIIGTLVVVFLLAVVALIAMGPLDSDHPVLGSFLADASSPADVDAEPTADRDGRGPQEPARKTADSKAAASPSSSTPSDTQPPVSDAVAKADTAAGTKDAVAPPERDDTFPLPPKKEAAPVTDGSPTPPAPSTADASDITSSDVEMAGDAGDAGDVEDAKDAASTDEEEEPAEPTPLARCSSGLHLLARFDPASESWLRMTAGEAIAPEQRLVALPTYRPVIALRSGVRWTLIGPASLTLRDTDDGVPIVVVHYGRFLATTDGTPDAEVRLQLGDRSSLVVLPGLDSSLALDVQRYLEPGRDPEENNAHWLIQAQVVGGQVRWLDQGGEVMAANAGELIAMIGVEPPSPPTDSPLPEWLDTRSMRPIDRDASEQLEPLLELDRSLTISLLEQSKNRLVEVRSLAIRCLCSLGVYDSFIISAFNDKSLRTFWPDLMFALQLAVAQDPESATNIRSTFERLRGTEGSQLFRFLWRYSPDQLADGGAETLVESLASPSMDIRVFAYENLFSIAQKTNAYQPELDPDRQRRAILNWQRDLEEGEIAYKTPPFEVEE